MDNLDNTTPRKRCTKCGKEYPATLEHFRKSKTCRFGVMSQCRTCERAYQLEHQRERRKTPEGKAYMHFSNHRPEVIARKYKDTERRRATDEFKEYLKEYNSRPETRERVRQAARTYRLTQKGKIASKAQMKVRIEIRAGRMPPVNELPCARCGKQAEEYHHWSYEQEHWLDVIPLCTKCHIQVHRKASN